MILEDRHSHAASPGAEAPYAPVTTDMMQIDLTSDVNDIILQAERPGLPWRQAIFGPGTDIYFQSAYHTASRAAASRAAA